MDHIEKLLEQTGWSCQELIKKLSEYKERNDLKATLSSKTEQKDNNEENVSDIQDKNNSKIVELTNGDTKEKIVTPTARKDFINLKRKKPKPIRYSPELVDHTYTLNVKNKKIIDTNPRSPRNLHLRFIAMRRRSNFLFRARRLQRIYNKLKKVDCKALIAQYKCPDIVRSQIMQQLQLLRSKRSTLVVDNKKKITEGKIVNRKRYAGEKCSIVLDELMELAEDTYVEIESNDIFQNNGDIIIDNDYEVVEPTMVLRCNEINQSTTKGIESITETIRNRIGAFDSGSTSTEINKHTVEISMLQGTSYTTTSAIENSINFARDDDDFTNINDYSMDIDYTSLETDEKDTAVTNIKKIVIVDVRGGCEIIPDNNFQDTEDRPFDQDHTIKPTKTKDITKIKGWKNKKFNVTEDTSNTAFASSNLDGFLEAADLHISFKIPTLDSGAPTTKEILKVSSPQISPKENDVDPLNLYRPRTLGQKKRIMKLKYDIKSKKNFQKPRTLAEKRRLLGNDIEKKAATTSREANSYNYSFILHRGKKLRVVTKTQKNRIIAYIKSTNIKPNYMYVPKKRRIPKDKPSIFKTTLSPTTPVLRYRPGPLSKKVKLQYDNQNWKTILKKLPEVMLTVVPEYKKPIHPYVRPLLPEYGFQITPDRLEFALTALRPQKKEVTCFEFKVPYQNNQQEILLREQVPFVKSKIEVKHDEIAIEEVCQDIVNKMLNYLEIKEISDDVIKNDVNNIFLTEDKVLEQPAKITRKRPRQANKTNYELKRLNVKVIEVNLEEKEEIKNCKKDFCRLGCICRSLSTTSSLVSNHCGRPDCMFECLCNYQRKSKSNVKVTLPIGTDLLSEGAVNRLEDEAKKNLAKVEKEFTQTVIQANNQTIVVGGCTNRQRRVTKLPKKYTDYIEDPEYLPPNVLRQNEIDDEKCKDEVKSCQVYECSINVTKLDLNEIIPFCLVHNLYNCHCGCQAEYIMKQPIELEKSEENESETNNGENRLESTTELSKCDEDAQRNGNYVPHVTDPLSAIEDSRKDTKKDGQRNTLSGNKSPLYTLGNVPMTCARTKGIPTDYYMIRNKTNKFIEMRNRKIIRNMIRSGFKNDVHIDLNITPLSYSSTTDDTVTVIHEKSRRKQELIARVDRDIYPQEAPTPKFPKKTERPIKPKIRRSVEMSEDKQKSGNNLENEIVNVATDKSPGNSPQTPITSKEDNMAMQKFKKIFPLAEENLHYFLPSPDVAEQFVNMLGKKTNTTFCLLQWQTLATNYRLGKVNIWFSSYFKFPKVLITDLTIVPKYFTNVKNFESDGNRSLQKNEIVKALISDSVPGTNPKEEVQVILELTPVLCHVHGTIKKNQDRSENPKEKNKSPKVIQMESLFEKTESEKEKTPLPCPTVRKIMFSKIRCLQYNYVTVDKDNENILPYSVVAHLPTIKSTALWRMIKLNSDFSVLSLDKNEYRIKYADLKKVLKMAFEKDMTIAVKTEQGPTTRSHKDFGIYACPQYHNAVFIGPYNRTENHDITLMRYVNRELIPTKLFNKMKGIPPTNVGVWVEQSKDASTAEKSLHTIDLTESDQEEASLDDDSNKPLFTSADFEKYENECENYYDNQSNYIEFNEGKKIPQYQGNVYFSTNVTALGYILGHPLNGDKVLVRYPTFNTVLSFKNHSHAVTYLQREFRSTFMEAPDFNIKIKITDKENNSGIIFNPEFLKGYYIVNDSGLMNVLEVTRSKLKELRMTELDLHQAMAYRASRLVYDQCLEAAKSSSLSSLTSKERKSTKSLLHVLQSEVELMEFNNQKYKIKKAAVFQRKSALLNHFQEVFLHLAPHINSKLKRKIQEVLKRHGKLVPVVERPKESEEIICVDSDPQKEHNKDTSPNAKADINLPIYTKNPDMIITATGSSNESPDGKVQKISIKDLQDLKENNSEKKENGSDVVSKPSDKSNSFKYLWKTTKGKILEIAPEQYEKLRANSIKSPQVLSSRKTFQIGPVSVTPKLSKVELEPLMATLPTAELKRISIPDNLPPGFVKLTLKGLSQKPATESNTSNVHR